MVSLASQPNVPSRVSPCHSHATLSESMKYANLIRLPLQLLLAEVIGFLLFNMEPIILFLTTWALKM